jgi:hypothetical protein
VRTSYTRAGKRTIQAYPGTRARLNKTERSWQKLRRLNSFFTRGNYVRRSIAPIIRNDLRAHRLEREMRQQPPWGEASAANPGLVTSVYPV